MASSLYRLLPLLLVAVSCSADLEVLYQWNFLPFNLPPGFPAGDYVPENNVFTGLEVSWDRIFVALPRLRPGVAATLAWLPRDVNHQGVALGGSSPLLQAYPNWRWHSREANCSGLISVYRMRADRCDRLWVLDSGLMDSLGSFTPVCPPKLLTFDLRTNQLVRSVVFPSDVRRLNSLFTNLVLDDEGAQTCDDMVIYISDTAAPGLVVYDVKRDSTWRISHSTMWPSPDFSTFEVAGETFTLMDGIVGLALSPPAPPPHAVFGGHIPQQGRLLYYQPLATDRLFSVATSALKAGPLPEGAELQVTLVGHKSSQSANLAVDQNDGGIYFCPVKETAIANYQPSTNTNRIIEFNPELLQFSSELVIAPRDGGRIWLISSRFQKFFRRTYNPHEINFRIMRIAAPQFSLYNNTLGLFQL
ncbi:dopaminechrome tautomerase [Anabrus simplex]|uniref:dopaminechrome tautomerase n=1 Tax=Anabrus simplex TaxID=316456 RepID=UPI0035A361D9